MYEMVHLQASSKILYINTTFQDKSSECNQLVYEKKSYSLILTSEAAALKCKLVSDQQRGDGCVEGWRRGGSLKTSMAEMKSVI